MNARAPALGEDLDPDERRTLLEAVEDALARERSALFGRGPGWMFYGPTQFKIRTLQKVREALL